jgi:hypothetical protein
MEAFCRIGELRCEQSDRQLMFIAAMLMRKYKVFYLDCANTLDPCVLYRGPRDERLLERIHVVRPLTIFHLLDYVHGRLERDIRRLNGRALLVAGIDAYETDGTMGKEEYKLVLEQVYNRVNTLAINYNLYALFSYGGEGHGRRCNDWLAACI